MTDKAGRWLRVSTSGQDEASQVPDVDHWCDSRDYETSADTTYALHGSSAHKGNPAFDRMWERVLNDLRCGRINVLVVWKQDRLDRKLQTFQMIGQVVEAGGRVEFVTQPYLNDLSTMGGRIALKVQEELAHEESKIKTDRITVKHAALRQADSVIGRAPYGFRNMCDVCKRAAKRPDCNGHRKIMVPVPAEASVIQDAAAWYLGGCTLEVICDKLNDAGRLPRRMKSRDRQPLWCPKTLSGVLRNEAVVGRRRNGDGWTVKPEAILARATWEAVIVRMDARATRKGISPAESPALLTSIIQCGKCDRNMYRTGTGYYCRVKGCKSFVTLTHADAFVCDAMAKNNRRDLVEIVTPGGSHDEAISEVKRDMQDAVTAEDFGRLAGLQAELERLRSLPASPARVERRESDRTVAEMWAALPDDAARRAFLLERKAIVTVEYGEDAKTRRLMFGGPWVRLAA